MPKNEAKIDVPKKQWVEPELVELPIGETRNGGGGGAAGDGNLGTVADYS